MRFAKRWLWLAALAVVLLSGCAGKTQIRTAAQFRQMAENAKPGQSYILMSDIDLGGQPWIPVDFQGDLDGNGKTVSNVTITQSTDGNMGLFASVDGTVENLRLENAAVTADEQTRWMGLVTGANRGVIRNCLVTGTISGDRETAQMGILAGNNEAGKIQGGEAALTATAGSSNPEDKAENLCAQVSVHLPEEQERSIGIAGDGKNVDPYMVWQDTTGSLSALPQEQQQRRQTAVDMMYRMGTVQWTPSEQISYTANGNRKSTHSNLYIPGRTYVGIPYNGCEGSYERFLTQMEETPDAQGRLMTVTGLEDGVKTKDGQVSGFILNMGNDCAGAVLWALSAALPHSAEDGGISAPSAPYMIPNSYNTARYGVLPAGGYRVLESDETKYADGVDARDSRMIIAENGGAEAMAEYYARAYRGDYLIYVAYTYNAETDTWKKTGNHARMLACEPMIIRKWNGIVDLEKSYVITHEQGDGLYDNRLENGEYETCQGYNLKQTSWRTDHKYTLSVLLTAWGYNSELSPGCGYGYVPVTLAGYTRTPAEFTCRQAEPVNAPNEGVFECNYLVTSATMTIETEDGQVVYEKQAYLPYRVFADFTRVQLQTLFPEATEGLTTGQNYYATLRLNATGGRTCMALEKQIFTLENT